MTVREAFAGNGVVSGCELQTTGFILLLYVGAFLCVLFTGCKSIRMLRDVDGFGNVTRVFDLSKVAVFTMNDRKFVVCRCQRRVTQLNIIA